MKHYTVKFPDIINNLEIHVTHTNQDLFSCSKVVIADDFPSSINKLIKNVPSISKKDIVQESSLVPLFSPFWPQERINSMVRTMNTSTCIKAHLKAGINGNTVPQWKNLRFCPACIIFDKENYGEAYWHRLHQVPCILICPIHETWLLDSNFKKFEINPGNYHCANDIQMELLKQTIKFSSNISQRAIEIARDIEWLLKNKVKPLSIETIKSKYLCKLKELDLVSYKGRIDQKSFVQGFIKYYDEKFLIETGLMPNTNDTHNWVSMMLRKDDILPHPMKHIFLTRYLYGGTKEFFNQDFNFVKAEKNLFESGPFPCLNPASDHYLENTIVDYEEKYSRSHNKYCVFTCECGFSYIKNEKSDSIEDRYKYSTINKYGNVWEKKLVELIETKHLHLRAVARILKVDLSTIRKQVARLNLNTEYMSKPIKNKTVSNFSYQNSVIECNQVDTYREKWLALIKKYPDYSKTRLKKEDTRTFNWLNYHNKQWLLENCPKGTKRNYSINQIDWLKRDEEIKQSICSLIKSELKSNEKPCRITVDKIGDKLGMLYLLRNSLNKLPKTKELLESVIETRLDYQKRKVHWAVKHLIDNGVEVKEWRIRELAGVGRVKTPEIKKAIKKEVSRYEKALDL